MTPTWPASPPKTENFGMYKLTSAILLVSILFVFWDPAVTRGPVK